MDNNLALKDGFTVLEVIVMMAIVGIILATVVSSSISFINRAKFQATVREMESIAEAALDSYNSSSNDPNMLVWPVSISSLAPTYMPQAVTSNSFGRSYQLSFSNNMVTVSTMIPNGVLIDPTEGAFLNITHKPMGNQISITQSISNEFTGRLSYDLKYVYKQ